MEKTVAYSCLGILGIALLATFFATVQINSATGNAYYERGRTVWAQRIAPSTCAFNWASCKGNDFSCPGDWMTLFVDGQSVNCVPSTFNAPDCSRTPVSWGGKNCNGADPNMNSRCTCP